MGFSDILGHKKQLDTLRLALGTGRLHHAYLFLGPDGVGKRTVALSLAKAIHCGEGQNDFCDQCVNCARITAANHTDVRSVTPLPGVEVDNAKGIVVDSTGALALDRVPKHLVVIGGGVIGLELGSVWRRLGAKITVVEFLDQLLPGMDGDVRKEAAKLMAKQGMELRLSTKVTGASVKGKKATLTIEPAAGGKAETLEADCVLVAIGRRPHTEGLGLEKIGLETNRRGQIETDHRFQTKIAGVWAIGDVIPGPMLAHKAEDEGIAAAENIAGLTGSLATELAVAHAASATDRPRILAAFHTWQDAGAAVGALAGGALAAIGTSLALSVGAVLLAATLPLWWVTRSRGAPSATTRLASSSLCIM